MAEQGAQREGDTSIGEVSRPNLERRLSVQTTLGQMALAESTKFMADAAHASEDVDMEKPLRKKAGINQSFFRGETSEEGTMAEDNIPEDEELFPDDETSEERLRNAGRDLLQLLEQTADPDGDQNSVWRRLKKR